MIGRRCLLAAGLWLLTPAAVFANHIPPFWQFKIGVKLGLYQPEILLLLAVGGLVISYWNRRVAAIGFAAFLTGVLLGFPVVFAWQVDMVWLALVLILLFGAMVALQLFPPVRLQQAWLVLAGACCAPLAFIGHGFDEFTLLMMAGFVSVLFAALALAFAVCRGVNRQSVKFRWMQVVPRVLGSWAAAAAILISAFYAMAPSA